MNQWGKAIGIMALIGLALLAVWRLALGASSNPPAAGDTPNTVLVEDWQDATEIYLLDVPDMCPAQRLDYRAWQKDPAQPASVEFVISKMNEPVTTTGQVDVIEFAQGSAAWALDATTYALTVRGVNARWRFAVTCD